MNRKLNWHPSKPDFRDWKYSLKCSDKADAPLPAAQSVQAKQSPVVDQGDVGSCTANAGSGAEEYLQLLDIRDQLESPEAFDLSTFEQVSRLFIYYNERVIEGDPGQDNGAEIRDCVKAVTQYGVCRESIWDYTDNNVLLQPTKAAYAEAAQHKSRFYYSMDDGDIQHMKRCIVHGYPFMFGFSVYDSFMSDAVASTGIVPMPGANESVQGGHAVLAVGYDDVKQWFIVKNSWGTGWGDKGYFYMPYAYISNTDLCSDFWTLRRAA